MCWNFKIIHVSNERHTCMQLIMEYYFINIGSCRWRRWCFYVNMTVCYEMTKITNSNQSHKSYRKYKSENGRIVTRTSEYIRGEIRCHGGESTHCWPATPAVSLISRLGKGMNRSQDQYVKNGLTICMRHIRQHVA
jgi:hypothetical protein